MGLIPSAILLTGFMVFYLLVQANQSGYVVDLAKSDRSKCAKCKKLIERGTLRIGTKFFGSGCLKYVNIYQNIQVITSSPDGVTPIVTALGISVSSSRLKKSRLPAQFPSVHDTFKGFSSLPEEEANIVRDLFEASFNEQTVLTELPGRGSRSTQATSSQQRKRGRRK